MKKIIPIIISMFLTPTFGASVIATVNGTPITDTDVTARTTLMNKQGKTATDNRRQALQNIIDDHVKLAYAGNMGVVPDDKTVEQELKKIKLGDLTQAEKEMAKIAMKSDIAWQILVAKTIVPKIDVSDEEIQNEKTSLETEHGLPIEMTIVRLVDIPDDVAKKLTKPKNCDDAMDMARNMGGVPQKFTAMQYELDPKIRERISGLKKMTWSGRVDDSVLLVCDAKKTKEYGDLDKIIKQNAIFKSAMFQADQQLKQLRRKAVVVINDDRYKL
ncbi:MAG: SurA N-terminal domain-containing protein [Alphaproteobacteria bacterium]|nr:SurA N-terminal domain-containing protein [Alphaproteobacteria bacterium]